MYSPMIDTSGGLEVRLLDAAVDLMGRAGRGGRVQVVGESMRPTLAPGDVLAVDFSPGTPRRGDLLLFRLAGVDENCFLVGHQVHRLAGCQIEDIGEFSLVSVIKAFDLLVFGGIRQIIG